MVHLCTKIVKGQLVLPVSRERHRAKDRNRKAETPRCRFAAIKKAPNLTPAPHQFLLRENLSVAKTGARPTRKKRSDGVIEWCSADGVVIKRKSPSGQTIWYDAEGRFHRDDGPAVENPDGTIWLQHGKEHREGAPAIEDSTGKYWFRYGKSTGTTVRPSNALTDARSGGATTAGSSRSRSGPS
jgi:hypothetical protein